MSNEILQGFDYLTDSDLTAEGFTFATGGGSHAVASTYSRYSGGQGLKLDSTTGTVYLYAIAGTHPLISATTTKIIGFALYIASGFPSNKVYLCDVVDSSGTKGAAVNINTNGSIEMVPYGASWATQTSATGLITSGAWNYFALKATAGSSNGLAALELNGSTLLSITSINTVATSFSRVDFGGSTNNNSGLVLYFDDIYVNNGLGMDNNDFMGSGRIQFRAPTGAGNYSGFTPNGAASNWDCVDDAPPDGDATYVNATASGVRDSYTHGALASSGTGTAYVRAVDIVSYSKYNASGANLAHSLRISGTDYDGATNTLTSAYKYFHDLRELSPATSNGFTVSEVNGAEIGIKSV